MFSDEFKAGAVRLVLDEGKTVGQVARDLDLTSTALADWVKRARAERTNWLGPIGLRTKSLPPRSCRSSPSSARASFLLRPPCETPSGLSLRSAGTSRTTASPDGWSSTEA
jgi:transposase-like protein